MQITIHKSGDLIESTKQVITDKITKLETYYDRIERADVYIKGHVGDTPLDAGVLRFGEKVVTGDGQADFHLVAVGGITVVALDVLFFQIDHRLVLP
ncbi:MAG: hypothetical protein AAFN92_02250, partial [Bacteroidota bacterium]